MKYIFEIYDYTERGIIFQGYRTVEHEDSESALLVASSGLTDTHKVVEVAC